MARLSLLLLSLILGTSLWTPLSASAQASVHVVKKGEALSSIARKYGVSSAALKQENKITDVNKIKAGSRLRIPSKTPVAASRSAAPAASNSKFPARLRNSPERLALIPYFDKWAKANAIDPSLLKATAWAESGWQNSAVSSTGARGIGQILPSTAKFISTNLIGVQLDVGNPEHNIRMSARYLRYLLANNNGDVRLALASYFQGPNSVKRIGVKPASERYAQNIIALQGQFR